MTCKHVEKQIWNVVSVCRVLGFGLNDPIFGGLGFPRSIANGKDARYPLGVYPNTQLDAKVRCCSQQPWYQFPLLRWDDDDRWETVSKCWCLHKRSNVWNKLHENVWTQVHRSLEKSHVTWLFSLIVWGLWSVVFSLCCHCPMMIKDGAKETNVSTKIYLWGHPWPINEPSVLCTSLQLSCCLDLNWMSWDLSWYLSGPYLDEFGS